MPPRGDEEVLPVRCAQDGVEALVALTCGERQPRPVREDAVHGETVAVEVVARRVEDDEVQPCARAHLHLVDLRVRAPVEGIVERVEVCALRDRGAAFVDRPVRRDMVML